MIWDAEQRRYEDARGHPLTPSEVRAEINEFISQEQADVKRESERLFKGDISVAAFFQFMRIKITNWHSVAGAIAYGGENEMTPERWARINTKILSELTYLNRFEAQVRRSFAAADAITNIVTTQIQSVQG